MSNMSYCRFENTLADLRDCYENWDSELKSEAEKKAKERLLKLCKDIVDDYGDE